MTEEAGLDDTFSARTASSRRRYARPRRTASRGRSAPGRHVVGPCGRRPASSGSRRKTSSVHFAAFFATELKPSRPVDRPRHLSWCRAQRDRLQRLHVFDGVRIGT
jgi:hypothetical protein